MEGRDYLFHPHLYVYEQTIHNIKTWVYITIAKIDYNNIRPRGSQRERDALSARSGNQIYVGPIYTQNPYLYKQIPSSQCYLNPKREIIDFEWRWMNICLETNETGGLLENAEITVVKHYKYHK